LGLLKLKLAPYNIRMINQTTTKPMGLIRDLKIYVHGIPYIITFIILQNSVVDASYSMLLGRPWLKGVKVAHDWGSNNATIQGNGIVKTITVTKHSKGEIRILEMLPCYYYHNGITYEEEDIIFGIEPKLFSIVYLKQFNL
jgi:carotenoid cleavage dioxygenase-like enzyme